MFVSKCPHTRLTHTPYLFNTQIKNHKWFSGVHKVILKICPNPNQCLSPDLAAGTGPDTPNRRFWNHFVPEPQKVRFTIKTPAYPLWDNAILWSECELAGGEYRANFQICYGFPSNILVFISDLDFRAYPKDYIRSMTSIWVWYSLKMAIRTPQQRTVFVFFGNACSKHKVMFWDD